MDEYNKMKDAVEGALATMVGWEVKHKTILKGGSKMVFRNGELMGKSTWFIVLESFPDTPEMMEDIPPQEEWKDSVFATISESEVFLMFWVFFDYDEMVSEMAKLFGLFMPSAQK